MSSPWTRCDFVQGLPAGKDRARAFNVLSEAIGAELQRVRDRIATHAGTVDEIITRSIDLQLAAQLAAVNLMKRFDAESRVERQPKLSDGAHQ